MASPTGQSGWTDPHTMLMAVNSYRTANNYDTTAPTDTVYVLQLPILDDSTGNVAQVPAPTSAAEPPEYTDPVTDHRVIVPCNAIHDPGMTAAQQVADTPFHTLERQVRYHRVLFRDNTTGGTDQDPYEDVTVGVSQDRSSTFSADYNVDVGFSLGVSIGSDDRGSIGGELAANYGIGLGYATTTDVGVRQATTKHMDLHVPAHTSGALWAQSHRISPRRMNGDSVDANDGLAFDLNDVTVSSTYPPEPTG
ncbi:hypothetical protein [Embleya sp. NPDC059259]|uniref:hypothetical protein n=1 Tax=unclassified Embleya TaxID=2699296 RepID=UPI00368BE2A1